MTAHALPTTITTGTCSLAADPALCRQVLSVFYNQSTTNTDIHFAINLQESPADERITRDSVVIPRWPTAAILDFIEPEIVPFDPPTPKRWPRTKHGVDRMHRLRDIRL